MSDELITVRFKQTFSKHGVGHNIKGREGETAQVTPEMAEYLEEHNLAEVVFDEEEE